MSKLYKSMKLGTYEQVEGYEDIDQSIYIILNTPVGTLPHNPLFGSELYKYIDRPFSEAKIGVIQAVTEALRLWEPRMKLLEVLVEQEVEQMQVKVVWKPIGDDIKRVTTV